MASAASRIGAETLDAGTRQGAPRHGAAGARAAEADLHATLLRFIDGRLRNRSDSEDIVQETWLRLYDRRQTTAVANVGAFCFAVARNLLVDRLRRVRPEALTDDLAETLVCPQPRADEILSYRRRVQILNAALRAMPPLRREIFLRRRLDEHSVATIASALDMSVSAVEKHVTRALTDLRHALTRRGLGLGDDA